MEAVRRLGHVLGRAGKGKTHPAAAIDRVEIEARCHGDPSLGEETPAEILAVSRQVRNVDIEVERPFRRCEAGKSCGRQSADQQIAIGAIAGDMAVEFRAAAENRERSDLRQCRRRDVEILRQTLD